MTWNHVHRRGETLRDVVEALDARRDGVLPLDLPGVAENFDGPTDLLAALLLRWHARLSGQLERALAVEPLDLSGAVTAAWRTTAEELPGVRRAVDAALAAPADAEMAQVLRRAQRREWVWLATAAGLATGWGSDRAPRAVEAGHRLEAEARRAPVPTPITTPDVSHLPKEQQMTRDETTTTSAQPVTQPATEAEVPTEAGEKTTPQVPHSTVNAAFVARLKAALAA